MRAPVARRLLKSAEQTKENGAYKNLHESAQSDAEDMAPGGSSAREACGAVEFAKVLPNGGVAFFALLTSV